MPGIVPLFPWLHSNNLARNRFPDAGRAQGDFSFSPWNSTAGRTLLHSQDYHPEGDLVEKLMVEILLDILFAVSQHKKTMRNSSPFGRLDSAPASIAFHDLSNRAAAIKRR